MIQLQKNKEIRGCPTPPTNNSSSDTGKVKNFVQFLLGDKDITTLFHLRYVVLLGVVIELVSSETILSHHLFDGVVTRSYASSTPLASSTCRAE